MKVQPIWWQEYFSFCHNLVCTASMYQRLFGAVRLCRLTWAFHSCSDESSATLTPVATVDSLKTGLPLSPSTNRFSLQKGRGNEDIKLYIYIVWMRGGSACFSLSVGVRGSSCYTGCRSARPGHGASSTGQTDPVRVCANMCLTVCAGARGANICVWLSVQGHGANT